MSTLSRRGFLTGVAASAVATAVPDIVEAGEVNATCYARGGVSYADLMAAEKTNKWAEFVSGFCQVHQEGVGPEIVRFYVFDPEKAKAMIVAEHENVEAFDEPDDDGDDGDPLYLHPPIRARFEPKRLDTLKPCAVQFIGREASFRPLWIIDEGAYAGQIAYRVPSDWGTGDDGFIWTPAEDLTILPDAEKPPSPPEG